MPLSTKECWQCEILATLGGVNRPHNFQFQGLKAPIGALRQLLDRHDPGSGACQEDMPRTLV